MWPQKPLQQLFAGLLADIWPTRLQLVAIYCNADLRGGWNFLCESGVFLETVMFYCSWILFYVLGLYWLRVQRSCFVPLEMVWCRFYNKQLLNVKLWPETVFLNLCPLQPESSIVVRTQQGDVLSSFISLRTFSSSTPTKPKHANKAGTDRQTSAHTFTNISQVWIRLFPLCKTRQHIQYLGSSRSKHCVGTGWVGGLENPRAALRFSFAVTDSIFFYYDDSINAYRPRCWTCPRRWASRTRRYASSRTKCPHKDSDGGGNRIWVMRFSGLNTCWINMTEGLHKQKNPSDVAEAHTFLLFV